MRTLVHASVVMCTLALALSISSIGQPITAQVTTTPTPQPASPESWVIIDLPPDASQGDYGREVYRLVCSACHGDRGQGLTDEWRATWAPEDQNCWQSKCHGANHPSDSFRLPWSPPVVGSALTMRFKTALELYNYNHQAMPWHRPGSLTVSDDWSVTAYLLQLNGIDPGPELTSETAAKIAVNPQAKSIALPTIAPPREVLRSSTPMGTTAISPALTQTVSDAPHLIPVVIAVICATVVYVYWRRRHARQH